MLETGGTQLRVGTPSMCTVQAPQAEMPQPYLVPVRPSCFASTRVCQSCQPVAGSTACLKIFSGCFAATSSMSMPPS